jgi:hypothetical protein
MPVSLQGTLRARLSRPVTLVDLSVTGCLVRMAEPLDNGSIHDLEVRLPGGGVQAKARVTEASRDGANAAGDVARFLVGLDFFQVSARDQASLRGFLESEARRCERAR